MKFIKPSSLDYLITKSPHVTKRDELKHLLKSSQIITELNEKHKIVLVSLLDLNLLQRADNLLIKQPEKKRVNLYNTIFQQNTLKVNLGNDKFF